MTKYLIQFGCRGCGKLEEQRQELGMTVEEHTEFLSKQSEAYTEVLRLEKELADAKKRYYEACIVSRRIP